MTTSTASSTGLPPNPSHYTVLSIPPSLFSSSSTTTSPESSTLLVKKAYRRALLRYHPDKQPAGGGGGRFRELGNGGVSRTSYTNGYGGNSGSGSLGGSSGNEGYSTGARRREGPTYTIDQITTAHTILSDPVSRREYVRVLALSHQDDNSAEGGEEEDLLHATGIQDVDLDDDMVYHAYSLPSHSHPPQQDKDKGQGKEKGEGEGEVEEEGEDTWTRPCRCGNETGFQLSESDLEDAASSTQGSEAEVLVGCKDCSLWIRVCFSVVEDG